MLTSKSIQVYDILFKLTTAMKCVPFAWNNKYSVIKLYPARRRARTLAWVNFILDDIFTVLVVTGLGQFILANYEIKLTRVIPALVYQGLALFLGMLKYGAYIYEDELIVCANKNFQTSKLIAKLYGLSQTGPGHKKPDVLLYVSAQGFMILTATIPIGVSIYQFDDQMNLYKFYFGPNLWGQLAYCLVSVPYFYNKVAILNFMTILMFAPVVIMRDWLMRITAEVKNLKKPLEELQTTYNAAYLYADTYWKAFCPFILTVYLFGCSFLCIAGSSLLLLFHDKISPIIITIIADVVFFVVFGFMYGLSLQIDSITFSDHLLYLMGLKCETPYLRLVHKSQRPIRGNFSSLFQTKNSIILTTFGMITENIASIVIGWRA